MDKGLSVSNDPLGRPLMICAGRAAEIIDDLAIGSIHLSLSDEIDFAVAFVVLEARNTAGRSESGPAAAAR